MVELIGQQWMDGFTGARQANSQGKSSISLPKFDSVFLKGSLTWRYPQKSSRL